MTSPFTAWHTDTDSALKRRVRLETVGKTFVLFEQQWRSETYFFGDLVYKGRQGDSEVFGLEDGIKKRPKWQLGIKGEIPAELAAAMPKRKKPILSGIGMILIAFLCLAIVYFADKQ